MAVTKKELTRKNSPIRKHLDPCSPLTAGNQDFGFTLDVTGLQSFPALYEGALPPNTLTAWQWDMLSLDARPSCALALTPADVGRIALLYRGHKMNKADLTQTRQELDLYQGTVHSNYLLAGNPITVEAAAAFDEDSIGFYLQAKEQVLQEIEIEFSFPYDTPDNKIGYISRNTCQAVLRRCVEDENYVVQISADTNSLFYLNNNRMTLSFSKLANGGRVGFSVVFAQDVRKLINRKRVQDIFASSRAGWQNYWQQQREDRDESHRYLAMGE